MVGGVGRAGESQVAAAAIFLPVDAEIAFPRAGAQRPAGPAASLAVTSVFCVQAGAAVSTSLFAEIGPLGTAWLRYCWAGAIFVVFLRPRPWTMSRGNLAGAVGLGVVTAGMTMLFFEAIARIPLATGVALEFLGPLAVAVVRRSGRWGFAWPPLAFAGVLLITRPWYGRTDMTGIVLALGAAACWAGYILLTQRVGDRFDGVTGLAISMPTAALATTVFGAAQALPHLTLVIVAKGAGLALLLPVLPYALELLALRRLTTATFSTLMSIEPAVALIIGTMILAQIPGPVQVIGILLVTVAAVGATSVPRADGRDRRTPPRIAGRRAAGE